MEYQAPAATITVRASDRNKSAVSKAVSKVMGSSSFLAPFDHPTIFSQRRGR